MIDHVASAVKAISHAVIRTASSVQTRCLVTVLKASTVFCDYEYELRDRGSVSEYTAMNRAICECTCIRLVVLDDDVVTWGNVHASLHVRTYTLHIHTSIIIRLSFAILFAIRVYHFSFIKLKHDNSRTAEFSFFFFKVRFSICNYLVIYI